MHGGQEGSDGSQYSFLPANNADSSDLCGAYYSGKLKGGEADCFHLEGQQEPDDDPFTVHNGLVNHDRLDGWGATLKVEYSLVFADLTSVTGYEVLERSFKGGTYLTPSFEDPAGSGLFTGLYSQVGVGFPLEESPANYLVYRDESIDFENLSGKVSVRQWTRYRRYQTPLRPEG